MLNRRSFLQAGAAGVRAAALGRGAPQTVNLALKPQENREQLQRMNELLNQLLAEEVGANDGQFLPEPVRPRKK